MCTWHRHGSNSTIPLLGMHPKKAIMEVDTDFPTRISTCHSIIKIN